MNEAVVFFRLIGSFLYRESTVEDIAYLKAEGVFDDIPYATDDPLVLQGQKDVVDWLAGDSAAALADQASNDYMKLFIGVGKVLAPPWGSCYLVEGRMIFQPQTLEVREFYAKYDLMLKKKYSEPDDHIGLELEFIAHLLEQGHTEPALRFAEAHVNTWIFAWLEDVEKSAHTGYYKGLARMAAGGIKFFLLHTNR